MKQTDVDLLRIAITAKCGTQDAFAKLLDMSRQNLNRIIRQAENNRGNLKPKFIKRLKEQYDIDIYVWEKKPTADFFSKAKASGMMAAEDPQAYRPSYQDLLSIIKSQTDVIASLKEKIRALENKGNNGDLLKRASN